MPVLPAAQTRDRGVDVRHDLHGVGHVGPGIGIGVEHEPRRGAVVPEDEAGGAIGERPEVEDLRRGERVDLDAARPGPAIRAGRPTRCPA